METLIWLVISLAVTIAFILLGRVMAKRKNRSTIGWGIAAAIFPPIVLVLLFLPSLNPEQH
jgi:hypothetical protein